MDEVLYSSKSVMWETPQAFFDKYNEIYHFNTDVCAIEENAKCAHFYSPEVDGLKQDWQGACWMNPPYGKAASYIWVQKAFNEMQRGVTTVALLPARTDTRWFHEFIYNQPNVSFELIKGRLKFGGSKDSAPFPSMVVVFKPNNMEDKKYNPEKSYEWSPEEVITLTGKEFDIVYNGLKSFIAGRGEISNIVKVANSFSVLQNKFVSLVEEGKIKAKE